jgi:hypothetical protein
MIVVIESVVAHPNHLEVTIAGVRVPAIIPKGISDRLMAVLIQEYVWHYLRSFPRSQAK